MMNFDINTIKTEYKKNKGFRELGKWIFSIFTFGLGGLYLWITTRVISEGFIGLRKGARGEMVLLPPGRHSNFPWESYPVKAQSLDQKFIILGPFKIITVDTGFIAKTFKQGVLTILTEGQYLIKEATHTFSSLVSKKQQTKKLPAIIASTRDNVSLSLQADVQYEIKDPQLAISKIEDIDKAVSETAEMNIAQIVREHPLADFASVMTIDASDNKKQQGSDSSSNNLLVELKDKMSQRLAELGISLINIGMTSWKIMDSNLSRELGEGAVVTFQTTSKLAAAKNAAEIVAIDAKARNDVTISQAEAQAKAIDIKGEAFLAMANKMKDNPAALEMFARTQDKEVVASANQAYLFFGKTSALPGINVAPAPEHKEKVPKS